MPTTPKKGKSQAPPMAKKILSTGEVRDAPISPIGKKLMDAISSAAPTRTNLGGKLPEKPKARDTPKPSKNLAIGERPVLLPKTAAKMRSKTK